MKNKQVKQVLCKIMEDKTLEEHAYIGHESVSVLCKVIRHDGAASDDIYYIRADVVELK